jgi:pimeloyl-ACP methyl ester carboxylesterase
MFWELPDDPRGSLRWSLSKIRRLVDDGDATRLLADRERVSLTLAASELDLWTCRTFSGVDGEREVESLRQAAAALSRPLLDGLDLPRLPVWQAWLEAEREEVLQLRCAILKHLAVHPEVSASDSLRFAREWHRCDPLSPAAARALMESLRRLGRPAEADEVARAYALATARAGLTNQLESAPPIPAPSRGEPLPAELLRRQTIGFCEAADGVRIAYATVGEGPPLVKAANWLNHLELDWESPIWGKTFRRLAAERTFIRYDERGNGLSDWDVAEISFEAFVRDLETVVDALGLDRFPLLGMSQGCAVSIEYAVRHPERVTGLILIGGYAAGWRIGSSPDERERREAVMTLTRLGWGTNNAAYRHIFSQTFMPDGTPDELAWFDEFQRQTTSAENAVRFQDAFGDIDVRHRLPLVRAPTLVLHARHDQRITLDQGRELAIGIGNARFVPLQSRSHIILGHEPAWEIAMAEIGRFIDEHRL